MAVTKLLRLKESTRGSPSAHLKHNLFYICNPDKCGGGIWIGGNAGTSPEIIYQTMIENKKFWGKEDGSQGFHYVISFPPELSVTEEMAYQIGEDFARELLGDDFYYAFAVHNDQQHMHVHITFDSVSKTDGYKFHSPKGDWEKRIQPITDRICRKYGLPVLEFTEEKKGKDYSQWKTDRDNKSEGNEKFRFRKDVSWYDLIRDDIDAAVEQCESFESFLDALRKKGYQIKVGKYLSLHPYGRERAVRSSRLGKGYSLEEIRQRILSKDMSRHTEDFIRYGDPEEIIAVIRIKRQTRSNWKMTPFQKQYYRRWNNSFLRNKPGRKASWISNTDVIRIRKLSDGIKYMVDHDIHDFASLEEKWKELQKQKEMLQAERNALTTKLYRQSPYRELTRLEKLKKEEKEKLSDEQEKEMASLFLKLNESGGIENVRSKKDLLNEKLGQLKKQQSLIRDEEKILEDLYTFYFEMPERERAQDLETYMREKDPPAGHEQSDQQDRGPTRDTIPSDQKWKSERTRITVHKSLIMKKDEDRYLVRIPGTDEYLQIPAEDALLYKSGEILSAFLYEEEDYSICNETGTVLREEKGSSLAGHFAKQKDRRKEKGR